jgi:hypothetical protein
MGTVGNAPLTCPFAAQIAATEVTLPPFPPRADLTSYFSASGSAKRGDDDGLGDFWNEGRGVMGDFGGARGDIGETEETGDTGRITVGFGAFILASAGLGGVLEGVGSEGFVPSAVLRGGAGRPGIAASTKTEGSAKSAVSSDADSLAASL